VEPFRDQKILITGGSSGIGKLMAETLAAEGAEVILWSNERLPLEAVDKELSERGLRCATYLCDVSRPYSIYDTAKRVIDEHGPIDILINNAGVVSGRPLLEITDAEIKETFDVNALAPIWTTRAFLPAMIERGRGHIVTIASAAGLIGAPGMTDYFDGVSTATPLLPILTPEYATRQIVRAIRRKRRRLLLPRTVLLVYLMRLFPTPIFDWIARALGVTRSMDGFTGRRSG